MPLDLSLLGQKLKRYREQFQVSLKELSNATGIDVVTLKAFENGIREPTGDEILILADYYKCDYKFFISSEKVAPFDQTEILFRKYGKAFTKQDRWAVQEILFLSENEHFLQQCLGKESKYEFSFFVNDSYYKGHGQKAASELRNMLGYKDNEVSRNIYKDFRDIGIHVFRRRLENSNISGLYIRHPTAGKCILINYLEDVYRQRFTAAHEAAHSIFDDDQDVFVSFISNEYDLREIRANAFASHYLMPPNFLKKIPGARKWDEQKALEWANKLMVSTEALSYALKESGLIDNSTVKMIKNVKVPYNLKVDPELSQILSPLVRERKKLLLQRGLSDYYVKLCFEAYYHKYISAARMAEMLLIEENELQVIAKLYGGELNYGS